MYEKPLTTSASDGSSASLELFTTPAVAVRVACGRLVGLDDAELEEYASVVLFLNHAGTHRRLDDIAGLRLGDAEPVCELSRELSDGRELAGVDC